MAPNTRSLVTPVNNGASGFGNNAVVDDNVRKLLSKLVDVRFNRMQESIDALTRVVAASRVMWERNVERSVTEAEKQAVLARFGTVFDDPMSELKNLKYETTTRAYRDAFDDLLSRIEISEDHAISLFMRGLSVEIALGVRMFKSRKLADVYCLTNLQEATLNAVKKKNKEYKEKRANNLCFYCDQKYTPGHKCSSQMYSLEVLAIEDDETQDSDNECLEEENLEVVEEMPQIS
nr:hypothetical protein [Tanacetum cinerariifolium]